MDFEAFLRRFEEADTAFVNGDASLWMPRPVGCWIGP